MRIDYSIPDHDLLLGIFDLKLKSYPVEDHLNLEKIVKACPRIHSRFTYPRHRQPTNYIAINQAKRRLRKVEDITDSSWNCHLNARSIISTSSLVSVHMSNSLIRPTQTKCSKILVGLVITNSVESLAKQMNPTYSRIFNLQIALVVSSSNLVRHSWSSLFHSAQNRTSA